MYQPMHVAVAAKLPTNVKLDSPLHPIANKHTRGVVATSPLSVKDVKIVLDNIRDLNTSLRNRLDTTYAKVELPVALQALAQTRRPLADIGQALGYADPSVFNRAVRRWTGSAPSVWRQAQQRISAGSHPDQQSTARTRPRG